MWREVILMRIDNMPTDVLFELWHREPAAAAYVRGSDKYPKITGIVFFYAADIGTYVLADIYGLPEGMPPCGRPIFGFHIHSGSSCTGNASDPFADTEGHFNPENCDHPFHAGDLPPLFGCGGHAWMTVFTDRFSVFDIIGKTVVIHSDPDDFHTQPSGNSGMKIACGEISAM